MQDITPGRYSQVSRDERPTIKMPAAGPAQRLFVIVYKDGSVSERLGWASAHHFLAEHPEYIGAQVVAL